MASLPPLSTPPQGERPQPANQQPEGQSTPSQISTSSEQGSTAPPPSGSNTASAEPLLNAPSDNSQRPTSAQSGQQRQRTPHHFPSSRRGHLEEPRKCWICYADETEDTPLSSKWRSPCPCALTAHESCLLDWVADLQSPSSRAPANANTEIRCPQCKSEIIVARPRSRMYEAVTMIDRWARRLVIPGLVTVVGGCLWSGCLMHGMNTIHLIFGPEDAASILAGNRLEGGSSAYRFASDARLASRFVTPFVAVISDWNWQQAIGIPLIPVILVLSRTSLADSLFPILPIIFFATQPEERERLDLRHWPPSAAMTLTLLPYLRGAYYEIVGRLMGPHMRRWAKEMQPRGAETEPGAEGGRALAAVNDREEVEEGEVRGLEMVLDVDIMHVAEGDEDDEDGWEDAPQEDEEDENQAGNGPAPGRGLAPPAPGHDDQAPPAPAAAPAAAPPHIQRVGHWVTTTGYVADTIMGALFFPAISSVMGSLLSLILPRSWTQPRHRPTGLLQFKWGRSIVGGCLFIVLKDAAIIYARWRQMQSHRQRRVLDYDKKKKRVVR